MPGKLSLVVCVLLLMPACVFDRGAAGYEIATLVLPDGHSSDGRDTFLRLGCASCHVVEWEPRFPEPLSANPGPALGQPLALQTSGGIATSIIVPSHHLPETIRARAEGRR
jgi:hypothetical protein